ncbi:MAG: response regulator, partial [Gammaproteobacteria bacterium]|nr:response regulator [Gammaproteobacteria bacterium]
MAKYALIVDDSRTARHALGAILAANGLRVETAASAEQALEHLAHSRPDVIFMDHQMPGMDGLQAVRVIKANPATATIPIMMYTSQGGELYVGQARALGAIGVLPKDIKPVEVSALLQSLRLVEGAGGTAPTAAEAPDPRPVPPAAATPALRDELELWVQSLLALQARELRDEVQEAVARALREHGAGVAAMTATPPPPARRRTPVLLFLVLALTAIAGMLLMLNLELQREWRRAVGEGAELAAALDQQRVAGPAGPAAAPVAETMRAGRDAEFLAA